MDSLQLLALALGGALWLWFIFPRVVSLLLRYLFSCHVSLEQIGFFPLSVKRFSLANGWLEVSFDRLFVGKNNVEGDTYFRVEVKGLAVAIRPRTTPVEIASLESRCLDVGQLYENVLGKLYGVLGWASYSLDSWKITIGTEIREESAKLEFQGAATYIDRGHGINISSCDIQQKTTLGVCTDVLELTVQGKTEICLMDSLIDFQAKSTELQFRFISKMKELLRGKQYGGGGGGGTKSSMKLDFKNLPEIHTSLGSLSAHSCGTSLVARKLKLCRKGTFVLSASEVEIHSKGESIASVKSIGAEQSPDGFSNASCHNLKLHCQNVPHLYDDVPSKEKSNQSDHSLEFGLKKVSLDFEGKALKKMHLSELELNCCKSQLVLLHFLEVSRETDGFGFSLKNVDILASPEELSNLLNITKSIRKSLSSPAYSGHETTGSSIPSFTRCIVVNAKSVRVTLLSKLALGKLTFSTPNFALKAALYPSREVSIYIKSFSVVEPDNRYLIADSEKAILISKTVSKVQLTVKGPIRCNWFAYVHQLTDSLLKSFKDIMINTDASKSSSSTLLPKPKEKLEVYIDLGHELLFNMHLETQCLVFMTKSVILSLEKDNETLLQVPYIVMGLKSHPNIVRLSQLSITFEEKSSEARCDIENPVSSSNACYKITLYSCEIAVPFQVDVHHAISNEFLGVIKWLRQLHSSKSSPKVAKERIAADILIYMKNFSLLLSDDPFEVKLRENFELIEDEYLEAAKRERFLDSKIEELRKTHITLPTAKVDELHANLSQKNAEIYIQRSKAFRHKSKLRTRLIEFCLSSVKFFILADESLEREGKAVSFIKEINPETPFPGDLEFDAVHFKWIRLESKSIVLKLRDFPQFFVEIKHVLSWGRVVLAEQAPTPRSLRRQKIKLGHPDSTDVTIIRSLHTFKMYQDLALDMNYFAFSHGPCWEPIIAQVSLAFNFLTGLKKNDPSPPLTWWDKWRYLFHGRLLWAVKDFKTFLHTSLDPYNTTEEVELNLSDVNFQLRNNSELKCCGKSLDLFVRTASRYDDCRLLHIPNFYLGMYLTWLCAGNPTDHHSVSPCTAENTPDYSSNSEHDSYRLFRSHNVCVRVNLEMKPTSSSKSGLDNRPQVHMYSSTIRWLESLKWLFSGTSRPIKRGKIFRSPSYKKVSFFRHIKEMSISTSLHGVDFDYWTSATMAKGILLTIKGNFTFSGKYNMKLIDLQDGLIRRKRLQWLTEYTNCEIGTTDVWFQTISSSSTNDEEEGDETAERNLEKSFFLSVELVRYSREVAVDNSSEGLAAHFLTVRGARCAWTTSNRNMAFAMYESWRRAHILREQLSSDTVESGVTHGYTPNQTQIPAPNILPHSTQESKSGELSLSSLLTWGGNEYVELRPEHSGGVGGASNHPGAGASGATVYSEASQSGTHVKEMQLEAKIACTKDDVLQRSWQIKFINCQMLLKGTETKGYIIVGAAKAEATKKLHVPVWKEETLLSKSSWSGSLERMQYFATVSGEEEDKMTTIEWLSKESIQSDHGEEFLDDVGAVGGVVGKGALQRIVSKCTCEFYYVAYGEEPLEEVMDKMPASISAENKSIWSDHDSLVDAFALIHHDLNICTNSLQYSMVLDILNNLLLFVDPTLKSRTENHLRMKYQLMLSNIEDQRKPITQLKIQIRQLQCQLRSKEKGLFNLQGQHDPDRFRGDIERLEAEIQDLKEIVGWKSEELDLRLRCLREFQISQNQTHSVHFNEKTAELRLKGEIFFSRAQWRLTETDGQLGIADAAIVNFSYTKSVMKNDSIEHLMEMGSIHVKNLLKEQLYVDVIFPSKLRNVPLDRHRTLRVFCREKPPVGGISVNDHFEINLVPLTIGITHLFYKKIMEFCFPNKPLEDGAIEDFPPEQKLGSAYLSKAAKKSSFYVTSPLCQDDVEQMKERAQKNKLFVYIKIPEVPINVSFKGEKEKNKILDVSNFLLQVPTIEYHNVTWTWFDLLLAVKSRTKDSLISQAIKQKLSIRSAAASSSHGGGESKTVSQDDEEKAKLLLGKVSLPLNKRK